MGDVLIDQDHPVGSVLADDLDGVELGVQPVQVAAHPVEGQPLHQRQTGSDKVNGDLERTKKLETEITSVL